MWSMQRSRGFTLLELIVVIAIIGVLIALLIPAVQKVRASSERVQCLNNLRQMGTALVQYHDANGSLPAAVRINSGEPYPFMSWQCRILPYLEQNALWDEAQAAFAQNQDFGTQAHAIPRTTVVKTYICPSDGRTIGEPPDLFPAAYTHYLGVSGGIYQNDGMIYPNSEIRLTAVPDGTSRTLMVGERPPSADQYYGWWYAGVGQDSDGNLDTHLPATEFDKSFREPTCPLGPYRYEAGDPTNPCDMFHYWSRHPGGANFLFADGSARFLSYSAADILPALATRAGGENVDIPE